MAERMVMVGDVVRVAVPGQRVYVGRVTGEARDGACWWVKQGARQAMFHKSYCERVAKSRLRAKMEDYAIADELGDLD